MTARWSSWKGNGVLDDDSVVADQDLLDQQSDHALTLDYVESAAVPGHDRGIRAGADPRTFAPRQAASRPTRAGQRAQRRAVRVSLCSQERAVGSVLRDQRGGGAGRSMGVRALYH